MELFRIYSVSLPKLVTDFQTLLFYMPNVVILYGFRLLESGNALFRTSEVAVTTALAIPP